MSKAIEKPTTRDMRPLLDRILDTPHLARAVPQLQPVVLHRIIEHCGLEASGELVALATPAQLSGVLDLDLWRSDKAGADEHFTPERFGVWLEVLAETGPDAAARTIAALDPALTTVALSQYIRVFDGAALPPTDEWADDVPTDPDAAPNTFDREIAGYHVTARRPDAWDAIVNMLVALDTEHTDAFHHVMRGCVSLSDSTPEVDGLDNLLTTPDQLMFDLATGRDQRRERQGYAAPNEARAFLEAARRLDLSKLRTPPGSPMATAYFRSLDDEPGVDAAAAAATAAAPTTPDALELAPALAAASAGTSLADVLMDEGILPPPPRALLEAPAERPTRLARIQSHLRYVNDLVPVAYLTRTQELAYLANTLVAGCSLQGHVFGADDASEATVAICNLGLENWPAQWLKGGSRARAGTATPVVLPIDFLVGHDLVSVFQVGWNVLHQQVCLESAKTLIGVLGHVECGDRDTRAELKALRSALRTASKAGAPWRVRTALDVLTTLDSLAWAALVGVLDECPVMHAALASRHSHALTVSATAFEFISENSQIAAIHDYMTTLPEALSA